MRRLVPIYAIACLLALLSACGGLSPTPELTPSPEGETTALLEVANGHLERGIAYIQVAMQAREAGADAKVKEQTVLAQGEFEQAITAFSEVLVAQPDNLAALSNLGIVYYNLGQFDQAIAQYQRALELAPGDAGILSNMAAAYVQTGQTDKALEQYQRAVELESDLAEAHFGLGVLYLQLGQKEQSIASFERFLELDMGEDATARSEAARYLKQLKGQ